MKLQNMQAGMGVVPIVFCVVPVHNRLEITGRFLEHIREQDYPAIRVIIVDDGSTDGTGEYLARVAQPDLTVLKGDGNLWWGGATQLGMRYVMEAARAADYLLMINNDVHIQRNYVSTLVKESIANGAAVVGSAQRDDPSGKLVTSGWHIDYWNMHFVPVCSDQQDISVQALPGRGVLFPMQSVFQAGTVNARLFPHYLGDLEYTARVSESGWDLLISKRAEVISPSEPSDLQVRARDIFSRHFSVWSSKNILQKLIFFSVRGPGWLRILAVPRYPFTVLARVAGRLDGIWK